MLKSLAAAAVLAAASLAASAQSATPVVVTVKVFATPGREGDLEALYLKRLNYLRKAEPEATFRLHRSVKDPNVFLWYETYPSQASYENHTKVVMANFRKEFGPTPDGIIARPSESEVFTELGR